MKNDSELKSILEPSTQQNPLPVPFHLIAKQQVLEVLATCVEGYRKEDVLNKDNNALMQSQIEELLSIPKGTLKQAEQWRLKAFGQIAGLSGFVSTQRMMPNQLAQLLEKIKQINPEIPDLSSDGIINFAGWNQLDYLLYNLYFLVELYITIHYELVKPPLDARILLNILEDEIWITANAYKIREAYPAICRLPEATPQEKKAKDDLLNDFVKQLLQDFFALPNQLPEKDNIKKTLELSFPCGSKGHAMYLALVLYLKKQEVAIRIDNPAETKSKVLTAFNIQDKVIVERVKTYLKNVCKALDSRLLNKVKDTIENEGEDKLDLPKVSSSDDDYPQHPEQLLENCVVEGFRVGMLYRLQKFKLTQGYATFAWLLKSAIQFTSVPHETKGYFERTKESELEKELVNTSHSLKIKLKYYYTKTTSNIPRIRSDLPTLPISEDCFINLEVVKKEEQKKTEEEQLKDFSYPRQALYPSYENIYRTAQREAIKPQELFQMRDNKQPRRLVIFGRAGIGKTTLSQYLCYKWTQNALWASQFELVVKIKLRNLTKKTYIKLAEMIEGECLNSSDIMKKEEIASVLNAHPEKALIILDGMDEFNSPGCAKVIEDILNDVTSSHYLIVTSRPYVKMPLEKFDLILECMGFSDEDIPKYIQLPQVCASLEKQTQILTFLERNPAVHALVHVPVLLDILCAIWEKDLFKENTLVTMTTFYSKLLIEFWEAYDGKQQQIYPDLTTDQRTDKKKKAKLFLEQLATEAMGTHQILLEEDTVYRIVKKCFTCDEDDVHLYLDDVITPGLLYSPDSGKGATHYYFPHLTVQEFMTAQGWVKFFTSSEESKQKRAEELLRKNKYHPHYQIVWRLAAGLLNDNLEAFQHYISLLQEKETADLIGHVANGLWIQILEEESSPKTKLIYKRIRQYLSDVIFDLYQQYCQGFLLEEIISQLPLVTALVAKVNSDQSDDDLIKKLPFENKVETSSLIAFLAVVPLVTPKTLDYLVGHVGHYGGVAAALKAMGKKAATLKVLNTLVTKGTAKAISILEVMGERAAQPQVLDVLVTYLTGGSSENRTAAAQVIGNMGEHAAEPKVLDALAANLSHEGEVCAEAACALRQMPKRAAAEPKVLNALITNLTYGSNEARIEAAKVLEIMGEPAAQPQVLKALTSNLTHPNEEICTRVARAIGGMGKIAASEPGVLEALITNLTHGNDEARIQAARALRRMGKPAASEPKVLDALIINLIHEEGKVRAEILFVLEKMSNDEPKVLSTLAANLTHESVEVRTAVATALDSIKKHAAEPKALDDLVANLNQENGKVRTARNQESGENHADSDQESEENLADSDQEIKELVASAAALVCYRCLSDECSDSVGIEADVEYLKSMVVANPEVVDALVANLVCSCPCHDEDEPWHTTAEEVLDSIENHCVITPAMLHVLLKHLIHNDDPDVYPKVMLLLRKWGTINFNQLAEAWLNRSGDVQSKPSLLVLVLSAYYAGQMSFQIISNESSNQSYTWQVYNGEEEFCYSLSSEQARLLSDWISKIIEAWKNEGVSGLKKLQLSNPSAPVNIIPHDLFNISLAVDLLLRKVEAAKHSNDALKAADYYERLIEISPEEAKQVYRSLAVDLLLSEAEAAKHLKDALEAADYYERLIEISPEEAKQVYHNLACCYWDGNDNEKAEEIFRLAIDQYPNSSTYAEFGHFLYQQQRYKEAISFLNKALKLLATAEDGLRYEEMDEAVIEPKLGRELVYYEYLFIQSHLLAYYLLYHCYQQLQQPEQAEKQLQILKEYVEQANDLWIGYKLLSLIYHSYGQEEQAQEYEKKSLSLALQDSQSNIIEKKQEETLSISSEKNQQISAIIPSSFFLKKDEKPKSQAKEEDTSCQQRSSQFIEEKKPEDKKDCAMMGPKG